MSNIVFSCIIPASAKDAESQNLKDLIASIKAQDFPQNQIEILVITEGDSEQAKAIGIHRAQGEICAMFCADNQIMENNLFSKVKQFIHIGEDSVYPGMYFYKKDDNSLNRYFSLMGGNDPVCWFLGKNDRSTAIWSLCRKSDYQPSYGCNGFFYRSSIIKQTNLKNYYPMDNAKEFIEISRRYPYKLFSSAIWHRTSDKLISFLIKRYKYARDLYSDRVNRRWKMLDTREDYWRLLGFIVSTLTIVPLFCVSARGFAKVRDWAWFWHPIVCWGFLITYTILAVRNCLKYRSLFRLFSVQRA